MSYTDLKRSIRKVVTVMCTSCMDRVATIKCDTCPSNFCSRGCAEYHESWGPPCGPVPKRLPAGLRASNSAEVNNAILAAEGLTGE